MDVIILTHGPFPPDVRIEREVETLLSIGVRVEVVANRKLTKNNVTYWKGARVSYYFMEFPFGLPVMNFLKLAGRMLKKRPSILQVCDAPLGPVAIILSKITHTKLIYDAHEIWPLLAIYGFSNKLIGIAEGVVYYFVEFLLTKTSDRVLTVSFGIRDLFRRYYGCSYDKIVVLRNLPNLSELAPSETRLKTSLKQCDQFLVVFVGGIDGQRRRELLRFIKAVNILKKRNVRPKVVLRIVGGEYVGSTFSSATLHECATGLGCLDVIKFVPWLPQEEAMQHILQADVCIVASEKNPYSDISFPNKLLQYIARGKPVLSSKLDEIQRTLGDSVHYYEDSDPNDIADILVELCKRRDELSKRMIQVKDSLVSILNWERESKKYVKTIVETSLQ